MSRDMRMMVPALNDIVWNLSLCWAVLPSWRMQKNYRVMIGAVLLSALLAGCESISTNQRESIAALKGIGGKFSDDGKALDLSNTAVTDADLVHLEGLSGLRLLNLVGTDVTDAGIAEFVRPRHLTLFYIWDENKSKWKERPERQKRY